MSACTAGIIVDSGVDVADGAPIPEGLVTAAPPVGSFVTLDGVHRQAFTTGEELGGIREWATIQPIGYGSISSDGTPQFSAEVARVANMCRLWSEGNERVRAGRLRLLDQLVERGDLSQSASAALRREITRESYN